MKNRCLTIILPLFLTACSTQAWYEGMKQSAELECQRQPAGSLQECRNRINRQDYGQYEKAREEAKKPASTPSTGY